MLKKFLFILFLIFFSFSFAYASEEVNLEFNENYQKHTVNIKNSSNIKVEEVIENETPPDIETNISENLKITPVSEVETEVKQDASTPMTIHSRLFSGIVKSTKNFYKLEINDNETLTPLLNEQMTKRFKNGPIESIHVWGALQNNFEFDMPENHHSYSKYNVNLINTFIDAKTRDGKDNFRIMFDFSPQHKRPFLQQFVQDVYFETKRIPHHSILFGNSRVGTGIEGIQSPYTLPFLNRSQISRNFSNIRKTGIRIRGDYKYIDYDLGGYSSDTFFSEFMPGAEFDSWINFKPLAKTNKYGKLIVGTGISLGKRNSIGYCVYGTGIQYNYKKLWTRAEYSIANGSNGSTGLNSKHRQGWYVALGYKLTKKAEILVKYDEFDPNRSVSNNNRREYTAGFNYYIKGQALKLVLNYIYCQNQVEKNSHRFLVGAQIAL